VVGVSGYDCLVRGLCRMCGCLCVVGLSCRVKGDGGDVLPVSLVMVVWSVVRICVRSSKGRAFSSDTR